MKRWAWVDISTSAIEQNVRTLVDTVAPAAVWAVVKANGYGHGSVATANAALAGGAQGLCVALVQEGLELRAAGIRDVPILVLSEQPGDEAPMAIAAGLTATVYSKRAVDELAAAGARQHPVHIKVDTGMRRVGVRPAEAIELADYVAASPAVALEGVFTHLAVADEPTNGFTSEQLAQFNDVLAELATAGHQPRLVHAANSAAALTRPESRFGLVRAGIAIYGLAPSTEVAPLCTSLEPALTLRARVSFVKRVRAGEGVSYGLRSKLATDTNLATLPLGYADGVPRRLFQVGGEALIGGKRRSIVGVVTMDQLMVDCGDDPIAVGDEAILIGSQGSERITVDDVAQQLGLLNYEVVTGLSPRLERRHL